MLSCLESIGAQKTERDTARERERRELSPSNAATIMATANSDAARLYALIARWPQRADLISRLDKLLSLPRVPDLLVYGPACAGKTSVVR